MAQYEAQDLKLRTNAELISATNRNVPLLRTRHEIQREACWKSADKVEMIDTCFQNWTCPPIYVIEHQELTDVVPDGEEHVFDGAHKLEAVFEFIDDKFPLKATTTSCKEIKDHDGKLFSQLPLNLKQRIRKYRFVVNTIDDETAHDPDRLQTLWSRLNRAGVKLNQFELGIPVIRPLIVSVLLPACELFKGTVLFPWETSNRGSLEQLLQVLLALTDIAEPKFTSQNCLIKLWHTECLGATMVERTARVAERSEGWKEVLTRCHKIMEDLRQLNIFCNAEGVMDVADALRKTELPFVLGRLARRFDRIEKFRSQKVTIAARLRAELFSKKPEEMLTKIGGAGRNGAYQKKLLQFIDRMVDDFAGMVQPRLFTKAQKKAKLKEQGGLCTVCGEKILSHQLFDGDHVQEWSEGGETTMENLQILHRHCHQSKL